MAVLRNTALAARVLQSQFRANIADRLTVVRTLGLSAMKKMQDCVEVLAIEEGLEYSRSKAKFASSVSRCVIALATGAGDRAQAQKA